MDWPNGRWLEESILVGGMYGLTSRDISFGSRGVGMSSSGGGKSSIPLAVYDLFFFAAYRYSMLYSSLYIRERTVSRASACSPE